MNILFIPFPYIDPVALELGPLQLRWYGIAYFVGISLAWWYAKKIVIKPYLWRKQILNEQLIDSFILYAFMGVVLGGRLGYVVFYNFEHYLSNPVEIFAVWKGGMSFHGGFLGVMLAVFLFSYLKNIPFFTLLDISAVVTPIGLFFGRIANFINGELYGSVTNVPWAFVFPYGGVYPRHPSQLYEAFFEGFLLFLIINYFIYKKDALHKPAFASGIFALGYGLSRIFVEFFRMPDEHIGYLLGPVTMGMVLSLPLILLGTYFLYISRIQKNKITK